jgi:hypothetical protein
MAVHARLLDNDKMPTFMCVLVYTVAADKPVLGGSSKGCSGQGVS